MRRWQVTAAGVKIPPSMGVTSWAAFEGAPSLMLRDSHHPGGAHEEREHHGGRTVGAK
jgi:hypothetical protein